jgi:hypothetical protein
MEEMGELMDDHIVHEPYGRLDNAPVEAEETTGATASPAFVLVTHDDSRHGDTDPAMPVTHAFLEPRASMAFVPEYEALTYCRSTGGLYQVALDLYPQPPVL